MERAHAAARRGRVRSPGLLARVAGDTHTRDWGGRGFFSARVDFLQVLKYYEVVSGEIENRWLGAFLNLSKRNIPH